MGAAAVGQPRVAHRSALGSFWRQFGRNRGAVAGLVLVCLCVLAAVFGPLVLRGDPLEMSLSDAFKSPSAANPLGTDELGRDILTRLLHGSRITLLITLGAVTLSLLIGGGIGLFAGFYGGRVDNLSMRALDILMAMPGFTAGL